MLPYLSLKLLQACFVVLTVFACNDAAFIYITPIIVLIIEQALNEMLEEIDLISCLSDFLRNL